MKCNQEADFEQRSGTSVVFGYPKPRATKVLLLKITFYGKKPCKTNSL
jgi:hypothetical protein